MQILHMLKKEKEQLKSEYKSKMGALNKLIDIYGESESTISDTEKTKQALTSYKDKAYKITELMSMLEMEGISVTRSVVHQALKQLREKGKILAFRINGSNQSVYYMSTQGVEQSNPSYPVKPDYRPVDESYVDSFEWLD